MRQSGWVGDVGHDFDCAGSTKGDPLRDKTVIPGRVGFTTLTVQLDAPPMRSEVFDGRHQSVFVRGLAAKRRILCTPVECNYP